MSRKPLTDESGEVRELKRKDIRAMRPANEVLPPELLELLPKSPTRGPQQAPTKHQVTIRLDPEVLDYFKANGRGWQTRINDALLKIVHGQGIP